ncbi:DUF2062 domain-containing protein [Polaromonas sp.]|uniref:DUF2062 domain-containing protein n=1 Tax=Polaromonas sp. TaxID=1869339 RepID=UPI002FC58800
MKTPKSSSKTDKTQNSSFWKNGFKNNVETREVLAAHPWLKPVAHHVLDPALWHVQHEAVARGVAIGIFWAFAIPFAQMVAAAVHCIWWRGNIPVAVGTTLITNPFTIGFWLWLAYKVGGRLLDAPAPPPVQSVSFLNWLEAFGGPALLGMGMLAVAGAATGYVSVKLIWRLRVWFKRRHR